jgi:predicted enzyme related to lactoylglutathione lyase
VQDPDGHFVELVQVDPVPRTATTTDSNIVEIRLRLTVADVERAAAYYQGVLGIQGPVRSFTTNATVMRMMGLPETGEYRLSMAHVPGSTLILELIEFKGVGSAKVPAPSRVQDPGSYRLQLTLRDIDATIRELSVEGSRVVSTGGVPVTMTFGTRPWRLAIAPDPNNLFLVLQQPQAQPAGR